MVHSDMETIEVSHLASEEDVERELAAKVKKLVEEARGAEAVKGALAVREQLEARREHLRRATRELAERGKALTDEAGRAAARLDEALIEGKALTAAQLDTQARMEGERRAVLRASERVVERLLPVAEIEAMEAQAEEFFTHARELRRVAEERIQKTAQLLAAAAEHEGEIAFDPRNTVSGLLAAEAEELERRGRDYLRWAAERRGKHEEMVKQLG